MNSILYRTVALVMHAVLNLVIVSYLVRFDTTGSWVNFTAFIAAMLVLLILFIKHLVSFIYFIKSTST
ncbi:MAG TPA: hypothetical protein PKC54_16355 [Ferruginibacter sp.]|nr:hypothetical protein [Ferruginibacter sp.]